MEESGQINASAALPLGKERAVPIGQEARWAPEPGSPNNMFIFNIIGTKFDSLRQDFVTSITNKE
jgi:hypothetical protein